MCYPVQLRPEPCFQKKRQLRLANKGLFIGFGLERLTDTRYADDELLYVIRCLVPMRAWYYDHISHRRAASCWSPAECK